MTDLDFLRRCLELARIPGAAVEPNPRVGAVVVLDGKIIGEGWHEAFGGPHAEVMAIRTVADQSQLSKACLYVSLEPCNHHGKTPPCTELIIKHGIPRVVVGSIDPNPSMGGKSMEMLRGHGVEVVLAEDQTPYQELNPHFWINQRLHRPFITLKWAQSQDGFIAGRGDSGLPVRTAISGQESARLVHRLRHEHHAILVGANTVLTDDPKLDTRHFPGRNAISIVLDAEMKVGGDSDFFKNRDRSILVNGKESGQYGNLTLIQHTGSLQELLEHLYSVEKIGSILVEGGTQVLQQFLNSGLADEVIVIQGQIFLKNGLQAPIIPPSFRQTHAFESGKDRIVCLSLQA